MGNFWSRFGAGLTKLGEVMDGPVGVAWGIAHATNDDQHANNVAQALSQPFRGGLNGAIGQYGQVPYTQLVQRPAVTFMRMTGVTPLDGTLGAASAFKKFAEDPGGELSSLTNPSDWKTAYAQSSKISIGQQAVGNVMNEAGSNIDPGTTQGQDFFKNTWSGRLTSGSVDAFSNWFLDPTVLAGKGAKIARALNTEVATKDVTKALAFNAGDINKAQAGRSAVRASNKMDKLLDAFQGKSQQEINLLPQVKSSSDGGALAYFASRANALPPEDARNAQRDIIAISLGNADAVGRLRAKSTLLANEIQNMMSSVPSADAALNFSWDDHGQGMLSVLNNPLADQQVADRISDLESELQRQQRLLAQAGSTNKVGASLLEKAISGAETNRLQQNVLYDGAGVNPVRIVTGVLGKSAPGHINTVDATDGLNGLRNTLAWAKVMPAEEKARWMDSFNQAATRAGRGLIVGNLDNRLKILYGQKYDLTPAEITTLARTTAGRYNAYRTILQSRMYSAIENGDALTTLNDEHGVTHAFDTPFLKSQLEDMAPLSDPRQIEKLLRRNARSGWIGAMTNSAGRAAMVAEDVARVATSAWKDLQLFTGKYALRVQADTQTRLVTSLGVLHYMENAGEGTMNVFRNWKTITIDEASAFADRMAHQRRRDEITAGLNDPGITEAHRASLQSEADRLDEKIAKPLPQVTGRRKNLARDGQLTTEASIFTKPEVHNGWDVAPARTQEDIDRIHRMIASNNGLALVVGDETANLTRGMRNTGEWGAIKGHDANWSPSYLDAVNKQFRNSPVAMRVMGDASNADVAEWMLQDPEARKEWADYRSVFDNDPEAYIAHVRMAVDHLLSKPGVREAALQRNLNDGDIEAHFKDVADRPQVHGQSHVPIGRNPAAAWWDGIRSKWYNAMSDMPETKMGRHPLYNDRFRFHMRAMLDRRAGEDLNSQDITDIRRSADTLARRDMKSVMFDVTTMPDLPAAIGFLSPFYRAWEDVMVKWGRLLYDDPSRAAHALQIVQGAQHNGFIQKDQNGKAVFVVPKKYSFGLSGGKFTFPVASWNIIGQGSPWWLPGFGPAVQVPTNEVVKHMFPKEASNPILKYVLPYGVDSGSVISQLEPNWVQNFYTMVHHGGSQQYAQVYAELAAQDIVDSRNEGRAPKTNKQIANEARNWFIMKWVTSEFSPVAMTPTPELQFYQDQAHAYQQKYGVNWETKFYNDFPEYFEAAMSLSQNNTGLVASTSAFDASQKHKAQISQYPAFGWLFAGAANTGAFNQGVYAYQRSNSIGDGQSIKYRGQYRNTDEAINGIEVERGWQEYNKGMTLLNAALEARGLKNFAQAPDLNDKKKAFVLALSNENTAWGNAHLQTNSSSVQQMLQVVTDSIKRWPQLAKQTDFQEYQQYIQGRTLVYGELQKRGSHSLDKNPDLEAAWNSFTQQLVHGDMGFEQAWNRVLSRDDLSQNIALGNTP